VFFDYRQCNYDLWDTIECTFDNPGYWRVGEAAWKVEKHRLGGATKKKYYIHNTYIAYVHCLHKESVIFVCIGGFVCLLGRAV
jgi:hypothetical protein